MTGRTHQDIFADQVEWMPGQDPGVAYARFRLNAARKDAPMVIMSRFDPGATVAPHTHDCNYFEYIVAGSQTVGKVTFHAGDIRLVEGGTGYGPIVVGPDGCTVLIMFEDGSRSLTEPLPRRKAAPQPA